MLVNSLLQELHVGHEQIVADELNLVAELLRQFFPAGPIVLRATVFDGDDRKLRAQLGVVIDQFVGGRFAPSDFLKT